MTEVRTTSSTGGQKGVKPQRFSLLPKAGLDVIAEVFGFGASKYDDHNWRKGYEWSKSYDALQRHLTAWWEGEATDPESGLSHLGHAGFHILVLATWERLGNRSQFDDRYVEPETPAEEEARLLGAQDELDGDDLSWTDKLADGLPHDGDDEDVIQGGAVKNWLKDYDTEHHYEPPRPIHFSPFDGLRDLKPYIDAVDAEVRRLASLYQRPTAPSSAVALRGDPDAFTRLVGPTEISQVFVVGEVVERPAAWPRPLYVQLAEATLDVMRVWRQRWIGGISQGDFTLKG